MPVISPDNAHELSPIFKGFKGKLLLNWALHVTGIDNVNRTHDALEAAGCPHGADFAKGILDDIEVDFRVGNPERLLSLPEGPFIVISNHIYGHIDGICMIDLFGHAREGFKVIVNEFLMWIKGLEPSFISVTPNTGSGGGATATSLNGIKSAIRQLGDGLPLGLFPSGAVADIKPRKGWILEEREWQSSVLKLIQRSRVPVVPLYFPDRNSIFYYLLELVDYRIRFVRLFHEMYNKRGSTPRVVIGETIGVEEQARYEDLEQFGAFLRERLYGTAIPDKFLLRSEMKDDFFSKKS